MIDDDQDDDVSRRLHKDKKMKYSS